MKNSNRHTSAAFVWVLAATLCLSLSTSQEPAALIWNETEAQVTLPYRFELGLPSKINVSLKKQASEFLGTIDKNRQSLKETALHSNPDPLYLRFRPLLI